MINLGNSTYYASPFPHLVIDDFFTNPEELAQNYFSAPYQPGFKTSMSGEFTNLVNHIYHLIMMSFSGGLMNQVMTVSHLVLIVWVLVSIIC